MNTLKKILLVCGVACSLFSCSKEKKTDPGQNAGQNPVVKIPYDTFGLSIIEKDFTLFADSKGVKWIGYYGGVMRYDGSAWSHFDSGSTGIPMEKMIPQTEDAQGNIYFISTNKFYNVLIVKFNHGVWTSYSIPVSVENAPKLFYSQSDNLLYLWSTSDLGQFITKFSPSVDFSKASNVTVIFGEPYGRGYLSYNDCTFVNNSFYICGGNEITKVATNGTLLNRFNYTGAGGVFDSITSSQDGSVYIGAGGIFDSTVVLMLTATFQIVPCNSTGYIPHITLDATNTIYVVDSNGVADKLVSGSLQPMVSGALSAVVVDGNNVKWVATDAYLAQITQ